MYFLDVFPEFTADNGERALKDAGIDVPPVDAEMLDRYIDFLRQPDHLQPVERHEHGAAQ
jgi:hypothetical protein